MMSLFRHKALIIISLVSILFFNGCMATYSDQRAGSRQSTYDIRPGDHLRIVTEDGRKLDFTVDRVTSTAIYGRNIKVFFDEIVELRSEGNNNDNGIDGANLLGGILLSGGVIFAVKTWIDEGK